MRAGAVIVESGHHIRFMDAEIKYTADYAIELQPNSQYCGVINCYIHDVDGGMRVYSGIINDLTPGYSYVENCHITRFSRLSKAYRGGIETSGVENRASYNEVHDGPHVGMMIGGFDTIIEYTEVYDVLRA